MMMDSAMARSMVIEFEQEINSFSNEGDSGGGVEGVSSTSDGGSDQREAKPWSLSHGP